MNEAKLKEEIVKISDDKALSKEEKRDKINETLTEHHLEDYKNKMTKAETEWEKFKCMEEAPDGMGHYYQAEKIAIHRAMNVLKEKRTMMFDQWVTDAIGFANSFPNIGTKYRDTVPILESLADYGLVQIDGDTNEYDRWTSVRVTITAKGYLATIDEWFKEREKPVVESDWLDDFKRDKEIEDLNSFLRTANDEEVDDFIKVA